MAYTPKAWADGVAGNTPITAADLNHLETQYDEAVATATSLINSTNAAVAAKYTKPASGIPASDFVAAVRASLALADSAVQPAGLTKDAVGLANVDNTSDANKPVSTATQTALDAKVSVTNAGLGTVYIRNAAGSPTSLPYAGSATANSIVMRDAAGAIYAAAPSVDGQVTTKAYVDTASALAVPASVAGNTTVFNKNAAGVLGGLAYAFAATANTLAIRNTNGVLEVGTPTATTHATTKAYVDSAVASGGGAVVDQTARDNAAAAQSTANSKYLLPSGGMPATDMAAAVQAALTKASNLVEVSVTTYGAKGDGVTNDYTAIMAAIAAVPDGGTVTFPAGTYLHDGEIKNLTSGGALKSVHISCAESARLVWTGNGNRALTFENPWDSNVAVTSLTAGTLTEAGVVQNTITAAHSGIMPWKRGDLVKVFSDDIIPGTRPEASSRAARTGQVMTVYSIASGSTVFLATLRDPMSTNIRMARAGSVRFSATNLDMDVTDAAITAGATGESIGFVGGVQPKLIRPTVRRSLSQAMSMVSCVDYYIENPTVLWAWNDGSNRFGYGVNDNASTSGNVNGGFFGQVRHGWTDSNSSILTSTTNPSLYGSSVDAHINNVTVDSATSSALDTHAGGRGHVFTNPTVRNSTGGIALRGVGHRVTGLKGTDLGQAFRIFSETVGGDSWGHTIDGMDIDGISFGVGEVINNTGTGNPNLGVRETRGNVIRNVNARRVTGFRLRTYNTAVTVQNMAVEFTGAITSDQAIDRFENSLVRGDFSLDVSSTSGGGAILHDLITTTEEVEITDRVLGFSAQSTRITRVFRNQSSAVIRAKVAANYAIATLSDAVTTNSYIDYETIFERPGKSSSYVLMTTAGGITTAATLPLSRSRAADLTLDVTLTAAATLPALPTPTVTGQRLTIINSSSSSGALAVSHGATPKTELQGATGKSLSAGQTMTLVGIPSGIWKQVTTVA